MAWRWHNGSWTIFHLSISDALFRHTKSMLSWTIKPSLGAGHCTQQAMCTPFQTQFTAVSVRIISGTLVGACVGLCKQMPPNSRERAFLEILTRAVEAAHARNLRRADLRQNSTNLAPLAVPVAVPQVAPGAVRAVLVSLSLAAVAARGLAAMSSIHQKHPTRSALVMEPYSLFDERLPGSTHPMTTNDFSSKCWNFRIHHPVPSGTGFRRPTWGTRIREY